MNTKSGLICRLFTNDERTKLKESLDSDNIIINSLVKIFFHRYEQTLPKREDLDKPNYEFRRAVLDGAGGELKWLIDFLGEK